MWAVYGLVDPRSVGQRGITGRMKDAIMMCQPFLSFGNNAWSSYIMPRPSRPRILEAMAQQCAVSRMVISLHIPGDRATEKSDWAEGPTSAAATVLTSTQCVGVSWRPWGRSSPAGFVWGPGRRIRLRGRRAMLLGGANDTTN